MDELLEKLTEIFRDVLDNDEIVLKPETSANDIEEWDSLTHIRLIVEIEKKLNIKFTSGEISGLNNIQDLLDIINSKN